MLAALKGRSPVLNQNVVCVSTGIWQLVEDDSGETTGGVVAFDPIRETLKSCCGLTGPFAVVGKLHLHRPRHSRLQQVPAPQETCSKARLQHGD
jgi:hypothetical protein